jgi:hypothetical protein
MDFPVRAEGSEVPASVAALKWALVRSSAFVPEEVVL